MYPGIQKFLFKYGINLYKIIYNLRNNKTNVLLIFLLYKYLKSEEGLNYNFRKIIYKLPFLKNYVNNKIRKIELGIKEDINKPIKDIPITILDDNKSESEIKEIILKLKTKNRVNNQISGAIYKQNKKLDNFLLTIWSEFNGTNALHPDIFPSIVKMEREIIEWTKQLLNGNKDCCGSITSGGTESILMACKAYRDRGIINGITEPEMILSHSAHAAFDKACHYFGIKLVRVGINLDGRINIDSIKRKINDNTVLIVTSAPSYNHGIIDDISGISKILDSIDNPLIGLHVDCCLGGFILPFIRDDLDGTEFDFKVPRVTSISTDYHKYGLAPKGISAVLYSDRELLHYQYFIQSEWTGGVYATSTLTGSRPGNIVALTYSTMLYIGLNGYKEIAGDIIKVKNYILEELKKIDDIVIYGEPKSSVIGFTSFKFDICLLNDMMIKKGWNLNVLQFPVGLHFCITQKHLGDEIKELFIKDIKTSISEIKNLPINNQKSSSIYGTSQKISDRSIIKELGQRYLYNLSN